MSVNFVITHSAIDNFRSEKRYDSSISVLELKEKLEQVVGTQPSYQRLELIDPVTNEVTVLEDHKLVSSYLPVDGQELRVVDVDPNNTVQSILTDDGTVNYKHELSEEKERMRKEALELAILEKEKSSIRVNVGDRCVIVSPKGDPDRVGTVQFAGVAHEGGVWIGVQFDEPLGKNDGVFRGVRYFTCEKNHGSFVKPQNVYPYQA